MLRALYLPGFSACKNPGPACRLSPESRNLEERMRVEMPLTQQSLIESPKVIDKKELKANDSMSQTGRPAEESQSFFPSPFGFGLTYSVSSLKAAVEYHAKFLTVAQSNLDAAQHPPTMPQLILDRLNRQ